MKPSTFFKKLSEKINELDPEEKKEVFCKNNLEIFKRISEYCEKEKKTLVITKKEDIRSFNRFCRKFNISMYYTRRGWAIFLTNFKGLRFTRIYDDRYRFLKRLYPNCRELKELLKKRNQFFEDVLR